MSEARSPHDPIHASIHALSSALMRHNIFYLLSALLMLIGCYIVCVPYLFELKIIDGLINLLGAINVYEFMVVLTCGFLIRHMPSSRESTTLLLVELLFLFDITFTINGCVPINLLWGSIIVALSLALAFVKIFLLEFGARAPLFGGVKVMLVPALCFVYTFQPLLILVSTPKSSAPQLVTSLIWMAFGALPLLLLFGRLPIASRSVDLDEPWWTRRSFQLTLVFMTLGLVGLQLCGQCWVHRVPLSINYFSPLIFSLLILLPLFFPNLNHRTLHSIRVLTALTLLIAGMQVREPAWTFSGASIALTPWRLSLFFAALGALLLWVREGARIYLDSFCLLGSVALIAHNASSLREFFARPAPLILLAQLSLASFWLIFNRDYVRVMLVLSVELLLCLRAVYASDPDVNLQLQYLRYWPLCALLASVLLQHESQRLRQGLLVAVVWLGARSFMSDDLPALDYFCSTFLALAALAILRGHVALPFLPAYLVLALVSRHGLPSPGSAVNWGWLIIASAFAFFGFAFLVTHRRLHLAKPGD